MHSSRKVFVLNKDILCVKTTYDAHEGADQKEYKTFDTTLEVGGLVLVPTGTRHKFTVVKIAAIKVKPDWESDKPIEWIVGKVDTSHFENVQAQETRILETVNEAERAQRAKEIKETMFAHVGPKTLQITQDGSVEPDGDETDE